MDYKIMPALVMGLTVFCFLASFDFLLNSGNIVEAITSVHKLWLLIVAFSIVGILYVYYLYHPPTNQELNATNGMWSGIIFCVLTVALYIYSSVIS
jgi:hypothetical protein